MPARRLHFRGESYISMEDVAACYQIDIELLQTWVSEDLIKDPAEIEGISALRLEALDRVADLVRYTQLLGLSSGEIQILLEE